MTAEVVPLRPVEAPVAPEPAAAGPVAIPPAVVARIAEAAVAAYIEAERLRKKADAHARYVADRERILAQQKEYRERRKLERLRHPTR